MKDLYKSILFIFSVVISGSVFGQLSVTPNLTATQLAQSLVGPGVIVSNATLVCPGGGSGSFSASGTNLGISNGILLTTGNATNAIGPNTSTGISTNHGAPGDPQLTAIAGQSTFDACILEFDVFSIADTLKFNYVFASDEYHNFVGTPYNDVFAFFITGPGITGSQNIALIPSSTTPVSIGTINNGNSTCPTPPPGPCTNCSYFVNNCGGATIEYDGFTTVLTAIAVVQPCQTYHLKLAISDANDDGLDSGVFIEAGSLTSTGITLTANTTVGQAFPNAIEGCLDGEITFTRNNVDTSAKVVHFGIGGTATNGVDYPWLADSITIQPNQASAVLTISPIQDLIPEGLESVIIYLVDPCFGNPLDSVTLNIQDSITPTVSPSVTICPGDTVALIAGGGQNYSWQPNSTVLNSTNDTALVFPTTTTTYTVNVGVASCSETDTVTVNVNPMPSVTAGPDTIICLFESVQLYASSPQNVTYHWTPPMGLNNPNIFNPVATPPNTTSYIVTVTDNAGCKGRDTVNVQVVNFTNTTVTPNTTICDGDSIQLSATGGTSYSWSPGNSLSDSTIVNPVASPDTTTTYTVSITVPQGCTSTKTVKITVTPKPNANAGPDKAICVGGVTQFSATGGGSYSWSPTNGLSNPNISNPLANPPSTTIYTLTVTNSNGCTATDEVTVTVTQVNFLTVSNDTTICGSEPVQLTATGGQYYSWTPTTGLSNPNIANPVATPTVTTHYIVTATDPNGCTNTDTVSIYIGSPTATSVTPKDTTICPGESVQLNVSGGISYSWSPATGLSNPNIANPVATPAGSTTYIVSIAFSNGCTNTDTATINVATIPVANAGTDQDICAGDSAILSGSGGTIYSWSPATGLSDTTIAAPVATPAATTVYTLTVSNAAGCSSTDEVTVTVFSIPIANAGPDQYSCSGNAVQLSASGGINYSWSPLTALANPNSATPTANPTVTTTYTVTVTSIFGCVAYDSATVFVNSLPTISAGPDVAICNGDSTQLAGSGGASYSWSPTTGLSDPNISNPVASPLATTTYTLTVADSNGCSGTDEVTITVNNAAPVTASADVAICMGGSANISASGSNNYSWQPASSLNYSNIANPVATPSATTTYTVTATDANGCTSMDSVTVTVNQITGLALQQGDTTICEGGTVQLGITGGSVYSWSPAAGLDDPTTANPVATLSTPASYTVTVTDQNGCQGTAQVDIGIHAPTDPNATPILSEICPGDVVHLNAQNGVTYQWSPAAGLSDPTIGDPEASPAANTTYYVTIEDVNGCIYSDSVDVVVFPPAMANAGPDEVVVRGQTVTIQGTANGAVTWDPDSDLTPPTSATPVASPVVTTTYIMEVMTANGCVATDTMVITVDDPSELYIPTAFSPNGDGRNDVFEVDAYHGVELISLEVYNRWGEQVFQTTDINRGWDGRYNGNPQPLGTYVYVIRAIGSTGERLDRSGNLSLIR